MDGPTISRLRRRLGITQTELSAKVGVDQGTVSRWERGKERPRPSAVKLLRDVLTGDAERRPFLQAQARIQADIIAAYLFDESFKLSAISPKAMAVFRTIHHLDLARWIGNDIGSHLVELGLHRDDAALALDQLLSGTAAGVRVISQFESEPLVTYLEPIISDGSVVGLFAYVLALTDMRRRQRGIGLEIVTTDGDIVSVGTNQVMEVYPAA